VTTSGDWFTVSPTTGETDESFTLTPSEIDANEPMTYTGFVQVTVTSLAGTADAVQTIQATLRIRAGAASRVYLPLLARD
jgi:hypothetical protein